MQPASIEPRYRRADAAIIAELKSLEGPLLPILHALQAEFGYVPEDACRSSPSALNLSRAEVHGVVTFYHDFRDHPAGRHVLKLCRAEACQSMGGDALAERVKQLLGIDFHETTPDGSVTLEPVYCLGLCRLRAGRDARRRGASAGSTPTRLDETRRGGARDDRPHLRSRAMPPRWRSAPTRSPAIAERDRRARPRRDDRPQRLARHVLAGAAGRGRDAGRPHRLRPGEPGCRRRCSMPVCSTAATIRSASA